MVLQALSLPLVRVSLIRIGGNVNVILKLTLAEQRWLYSLSVVKQSAEKPQD